ncbi:MAG: hypothetical protein VX809_00115, partial [Pseudomonadota bacterium]|nr:hypothetical protein [Pseudomonadota bacterium]
LSIKNNCNQIFARRNQKLMPGEKTKICSLTMTTLSGQPKKKFTDMADDFCGRRFNRHPFA